VPTLESSGFCEDARLLSSSGQDLKTLAVPPSYKIERKCWSSRGEGGAGWSQSSKGKSAARYAHPSCFWRRKSGRDPPHGRRWAPGVGPPRSVKEETGSRIKGEYQEQRGWEGGGAGRGSQVRASHLLETLVDAVGRARLFPAIHNVPDIVALLGLDTVHLVEDPHAGDGVPRAAQLGLGR
jgi:hypothetical protein